MSITLTGAEILDLAEFAGFVVDRESYDDEMLETELTIKTCPTGGLIDEEDEARKLYYVNIAYFTEYPEEGCIGIGPELEVIE